MRNQRAARAVRHTPKATALNRRSFSLARLTAAGLTPTTGSALNVRAAPSPTPCGRRLTSGPQRDRSGRRSTIHSRARAGRTAFRGDLWTAFRDLGPAHLADAEVGRH